MAPPTVSKSARDIARLAAIVGDEHTRAAGNAVIVAPADIAEVAAVLRFAQAGGLTVSPAGSGTRRGWGNPVAPDICLSLTRMTALREHAWQDMTCTVEAGSSWSALQTQLAEHGQMVALDPLWPERATVGGIVATNDSGALRLRYGGLRDLIIGMTVVLADGSVAKTGGKVVKNVAGYDLHKLMTGSFGTLGIIADVNFRLHPLEKQTSTWTAEAPDASAFAAPLRVLLDTQMTLSSVQLRAGSQGCALDLRASATPDCLDENETRLRAIFAATGINPASESVWLARQNLFGRRGAVVLKLSLLPSRLCAVCSELQREPQVSIVAQATGLAAVALDPEAALPLIERIRATAGPAASAVVLQLPVTLRPGLDIWDARSAALPLMREIKRRFDPDRILNPGRFVGGI